MVRQLIIAAALHLVIQGQGFVSRLQLMAAPVIEGVRMPDDVSDVIIHRNGKFFSNSFIPGDSTVSIKLEEPAKIRGKAAVKLRRRSRSSFSDDSTLKAAGPPVYYSPEEPSLIHSDRSPYSFEPAASGLQPRPGQGIMTASSGDFVIREHTYQMCPECPTFSIPIPIPRVSAAENRHDTDTTHELQESENKETILDKVRGMISSARSSVTDVVSNILRPHKTRRVAIEKRISSPAASPPVSPLAMAGLAVLGLGVARLLSAGGADTGRDFGSENTEADLAVTTNDLYSLDNLDYNSLDPICVPRNYCETVKRKKYLIDQFPMVKRIGMGVAEMVWDRDHVSQRGEAVSLCNLRECVFSLLR